MSVLATHSSSAGPVRPPWRRWAWPRPLLRRQQLRHGADDGRGPAGVPGHWRRPPAPRSGRALAGRVVVRVRGRGAVGGAHVPRACGLPSGGRGEEQIVQVRAFLHFARAQPAPDAHLPHRGARVPAGHRDAPAAGGVRRAGQHGQRDAGAAVRLRRRVVARVAGPLTHVPAMGAAGAALSTLLCTAMEVLIVARAVQAIPVPAPSRRRPVKADQLAGVPGGAAHWPAHRGGGGRVRAGGRAGREAGAGERGRAPDRHLLRQPHLHHGAGHRNAGSVRVGWAVGAHDTPQARRSGLMAFASARGSCRSAGSCSRSSPGAWRRWPGLRRRCCRCCCPC